MSEETLDTLTSIEAKVLQMRYGIKDFDERHSLRVLRIRHGGKIMPEKSASEVAQKLGQDTLIIQETETTALRKLRSVS